MSIENDLNRIANALESLAGRQFPLGSSDNQTVVEAETPAPAPRKPGRPSKDAAPAATPAAIFAPEATGVPVTLDMLKEALRKVVKKETAGPAAAKAILTKFGVQAVTAIEPARYAELHKAFTDAAA